MTGDDPREERGPEFEFEFDSDSDSDLEDEGEGKDKRAGLRTDGGAAGADDVALDPWGSSTVSDYRKLFEEFGIEEFDDVLPEVPHPHYLMRRGVIFGQRDYRPVVEALQNDEPAAVLSGFMPTGDPHIGHKLVFDEIIWHQQQGADAYALIADLEANSARGMSWEEIDEHARSYLLSLLALGFDPEEGDLYRQSTNREVQDLAFDLGAEANFSEFQAIYGFDGETDVSHMQSVVTQMADILYPQLEEPKPTVIPVGPDQDPHVRLARDLAERMRFFKVSTAYASFELDDGERDLVARFHEELDPADFDDDQLRCVHVAQTLEATPLSELEVDASTLDGVLTKLNEAGMEPLRPRIRFSDRRATEDAFDALIDAIDGEKRVYENHIDAFEIDRADAAELAREIEVDNGGYGFQPPSSIYHRFMTGLTGGKMSSSVPASHISLLDDPEDGYNKVKSATTGGRETAEEQREKGGKADECPVYELYAYLLASDVHENEDRSRAAHQNPKDSEDDDEFAKRVYDECVGGERLCGDCKEQAAQLMKEFLAEHQEKRAEVEELLEKADIELESPRRR
ncbi:tryptophan--tRNA ligase [Natrialba magadii ATCC 43099]|uniref:Tryptophan--tRNA ligase n=1 Tax=Natrialba magadii (strain ATCC 43099 / DSM 3394 / CCM 3739 / CIP 104546 / IAM 13178 / JCM 8861 / NBRC 102185 / NCIMB 2190 / MS3) TaxID=547559 RepID=D3SUL2_NATMM|nr:tryptophan--tRNA ligase [Natrialba magadii]ADD05270.1 tryptophan--tRNA ligase [Natrialba magadii ATCC 43099]ELY29008.1 tryptophanyl-tRNA ligase [Natrialba magadii ATCC 43099]